MSLCKFFKPFINSIIRRTVLLHINFLGQMSLCPQKLNHSILLCYWTLYSTVTELNYSKHVRLHLKVMAHAQKPDFVFCWNRRVHLNWWRRQFSRLLAAEVYASALVMLDTPCSEVVWEYWLPNPFASFPFTSPSCVTVCHQVSKALYQSTRSHIRDDPNLQ